MAIIVYGKANCPSCVDLKAALESLERPYQYIDVGVDSNAREELMANGFRSLPQAKLNGQWVNDLSEVVQ